LTNIMIVRISTPNLNAPAHFLAPVRVIIREPTRRSCGSAGAF
jgi:hypothetical protein